MLKLASIALAAVLLTGCASENYRLYAETQKSIANANAMAEAARYQALSEIAKQGDTTAKVAAVISLNRGGNALPTQQQIAPPKSMAETALQWTGVLLPSIVQGYSINANRQIAITQSNNATATAMSTNQTMQGIANAGFTAATTIGSRPTTSITVGRDYNSGDNSGNNGQLVNGTVTNNTATPTIVTQPPPIVVPIPAIPLQ